MSRCDKMIRDIKIRDKIGKNLEVVLQKADSILQKADSITDTLSAIPTTG